MDRQAGIDSQGQLIGVYEAWAFRAAKAGRLSGPLLASIQRCEGFRPLSRKEAEEIGEASLARIARAQRGMAEGLYETFEKLEDGARKALASVSCKRPNLEAKGGPNASG